MTFSLFRAFDAFQLTPSRRATLSNILVAFIVSFQLTPSRRATLARLQLAMRIGISTHALTEGDCKRAWYRTELR